MSDRNITDIIKENDRLILELVNAEAKYALADSRANKLEKQLECAVKALKEYEKLESCTGFSCCGECGNTYHAEEALEQIEKIGKSLKSE